MFLYSGGLTGKFLPNRLLLTGFFYYCITRSRYYRFRVLLSIPDTVSLLNLFKRLLKKKLYALKPKLLLLLAPFSRTILARSVHENEKIEIYTSLPVFPLTDK